MWHVHTKDNQGQIIWSAFGYPSTSENQYTHHLVNDTSTMLPLHVPSSRTTSRVRILNEALDVLSNQYLIDNSGDNMRILMMMSIMNNAAVFLPIVSLEVELIRITNIFVKNISSILHDWLSSTTPHFSLTVVEHVVFLYLAHLGNEILDRMVNP